MPEVHRSEDDREVGGVMTLLGYGLPKKFLENKISHLEAKTTRLEASLHEACAEVEKLRNNEERLETIENLFNRVLDIVVQHLRDKTKKARDGGEGEDGS